MNNKPTEKNERILSLLVRARRLRDRKRYSIQDVRDILCEEYLAEENKVSVSTVIRWFQETYQESIDGETALAIQNWLEDYE